MNARRCRLHAAPVSPRRRPCRRSGFMMLLVLVLFVMLGGLATVLTLHAGQLARDHRLRSLDLELRQMIDSGVAYAELHRGDWSATNDRIVLGATALTHGDRTAQVTLEPTFDAAGQVQSADVTARIHLPRGKTRTLTSSVMFEATDATDV